MTCSEPHGEILVMAGTATTNLRIVVADRSTTLFYDIPARGAPLQLVAKLHDNLARLKDRDLKTDRPGRVFDRAPPAAGRRGAVGHHATGGERSPRRQAAQRFAHRIGAALEAARKQNRFERIVLMAAPSFLGELRESLSPSLRKRIAGEVHKDLVHQELAAVGAHLPPHAFGAQSRRDAGR